MRLMILPFEPTLWETWKSPLADMVLTPTVFGEASVSCWSMVGTIVVPHRGAREAGVGIAEARARREEMPKRRAD